ncbi:hypothetical protein EV401DRAFT_2119613 [Pisolithus croceorrhizus]|nr:hypothetical protein EV401DRAFT_2119613 [Pisolithus croceorrhizus]
MFQVPTGGSHRVSNTYEKKFRPSTLELRPSPILDRGTSCGVILTCNGAFSIGLSSHEQQQSKCLPTWWVSTWKLRISNPSYYFPLLSRLQLPRFTEISLFCRGNAITRRITTKPDLDYSTIYPGKGDLRRIAQGRISYLLDDRSGRTINWWRVTGKHRTRNELALLSRVFRCGQPCLPNHSLYPRSNKTDILSFHENIVGRRGWLYESKGAEKIRRHVGLHRRDGTTADAWTLNRAVLFLDEKRHH